VPPKYETIHNIFGDKIFDIICRIYGLLNNKIAQVICVAKKN